METLVLSIIGTDRTGLVEALAEILAEHGGSWQRSQLTELAGVFAGMVLVHVPADRVDALSAALEPLRDRGLLEVTVRAAATDELSDDAPAVAVEVVGTDRVGIVHEVSHALADLGVGIVDLRTWTESAAMDGGTLFRANALVRLPAGVNRTDVAGALEALSDDLMVDVSSAGDATSDDAVTS